MKTFNNDTDTDDDDDIIIIIIIFHSWEYTNRDLKIIRRIRWKEKKKKRRRSSMILAWSNCSRTAVERQSNGRRPRVVNNNNNNNQDDIYSAVVMTTRWLREFTRFIWWMWNSAKRPPTLRPSHLTWAVSPPVGSYRLQPPSPFIIITQPESWYSFTVPQRVEGWVDLGTAGKVHTPHSPCPRL